MAVELQDRVWWLRLKGLPAWGINSYLVDDNGTLTLVDAGLPWNASRIRESVEETGHSVSDIDRVLLTHYDLDHFGGLLGLGSDLDAVVYAGEVDAGFLSGDSTPPLLNTKGAFHRVLSRVTPDLPVIPLSDGDSVGGFSAYHTPGHNPGHMAYVDDSIGVGFLGDLVRERAGVLRPPVWWDNYSLKQVHRSIRKLSDRLPNFDVVGMGHGTPLTTDGSRELDRLAQEL